MIYVSNMVIFHGYVKLRLSYAIFHENGEDFAVTLWYTNIAIGNGHE